MEHPPGDPLCTIPLVRLALRDPQSHQPRKLKKLAPSHMASKLGPESSLLGIPYLGTYGLRHLNSFSWCALSHPFSEQLQSNKEKATLIFHEFLFGRRSLCSDLPGPSPAQELGGWLISGQTPLVSSPESPLSTDIMHGLTKP